MNHCIQLLFWKLLYPKTSRDTSMEVDEIRDFTRFSCNSLPPCSSCNPTMAASFFRLTLLRLLSLIGWPFARYFCHTNLDEGALKVLKRVACREGFSCRDNLSEREAVRLMSETRIAPRLQEQPEQPMDNEFLCAFEFARDTTSDVLGSSRPVALSKAYQCVTCGVHPLRQGNNSGRPSNERWNG